MQEEHNQGSGEDMEEEEEDLLGKYGHIGHEDEHEEAYEEEIQEEVLERMIATAKKKTKSRRAASPYMNSICEQEI